MRLFDGKNNLKSHLACDVFELVVWLGLYEELSSADIRDFLRDCGLEDDSLHKWAGDLMSTEAGEDAVDSLISEYFRHFKMRASLIGSAYPFTVENKIISMKRGYQNSPRYLFVLACSRLDALSRSLQVRGGLYFEKIGAIAAKAAFGSQFSVHSLGTSRRESSVRIFSSNKERMFLGLARWLNDSIDEGYLEDAKGSSGDHGVDIIGRIRVDRLGRGALTFLGQCAASSNDEYWKTKRNDVEKMKEIIVFSSEPVTCLFIPLFYRKLGGDWQNLTGLKGLFLFDRCRMASILGEALCDEGERILRELRDGYNSKFEGLAAA